MSILFTSRQLVFAPQESMLFVQNESPAESGSREKKSTYCCRTKNSGVSSGFAVTAAGRAVKTASVLSARSEKVRACGLKL